jgi:hypothetical protein
MIRSAIKQLLQSLADGQLIQIQEKKSFVNKIGDHLKFLDTATNFVLDNLPNATDQTLFRVMYDFLDEQTLIIYISFLHRLNNDIALRVCDLVEYAIRQSLLSNGIQALDSLVADNTDNVL